MEPSFYETFSIETAARLRAHDQWMEAHEARMQAHEETLREMRADHAVWLQTQEGHTQSFKAIMDRLAAGLIDHEGRLSQNERTFEAIATTLKAINAKL